MKKLFLTTAAFLSCLAGLLAQGYVTVVIDGKLTAALAANHAVTMGAFMPMADAAENIRKDQEDIAARALVIRGITDLTYKSLSEVSALIQEGQNWQTVRKLVKEIGEYQAEMAGYPQDNPMLTVVAMQAGSAMASRSVVLVKYVLESALTGGDENLINSRQRMEIIRKVIKELRGIRAMAFEASRRLRIAGGAHVAASTYPSGLRYPASDQALVSNLLNNL